MSTLTFCSFGCCKTYLLRNKSSDEQLMLMALYAMKKYGLTHIVCAPLREELQIFHSRPEPHLLSLEQFRSGQSIPNAQVNDRVNQNVIETTAPIIYVPLVVNPVVKPEEYRVQPTV